MIPELLEETRKRGISECAWQHLARSKKVQWIVVRWRNTPSTPCLMHENKVHKDVQDVPVLTWPWLSSAAAQPQDHVIWSSSYSHPALESSLETGGSWLRAGGLCPAHVEGLVPHPPRHPKEKNSKDSKVLLIPVDNLATNLCFNYQLMIAGKIARQVILAVESTDFLQLSSTAFITRRIVFLPSFPSWKSRTGKGGKVKQLLFQCQ